MRQAGPGAYTVANLQSGKGEDRYGAWDLVVAYRDPTQPARNLTVFDGLATISQSTSAATLSLSGFTTPPTGPVRSVVGLISSEGDNTSTGDSATLNSTPLTDDLNPPNNVFNSSISQLGVRFTAKTPDYVNQLGSDANSFGADGYLANGATSATIRLTTGGETYYPSVVFFTTEIYSPEIRPAKSVVDVNGGAPERGDVLEYTVRLTNAGQDAATGLRFFDPIPARSTYVPGSLGITPVAPGATCPAFPTGPGPSDAADGDQAEFDPAANRAVYRVGTGASGDASGRLDPGQTVCVRLRVTIDADAPLGTQVVNQGFANFFGETLGTPFPNVLSNEAALTVSGADLVATKTHAGGDLRGRPVLQLHHRGAQRRRPRHRRLDGHGHRPVPDRRVLVGEQRRRDRLELCHHHPNGDVHAFRRARRRPNLAADHHQCDGAQPSSGDHCQHGRGGRRRRRRPDQQQRDRRGWGDRAGRPGDHQGLRRDDDARPARRDLHPRDREPRAVDRVRRAGHGHADGRFRPA